MTVAIWNARYETGIELIDAQHRSLFDAINQLAEAFRLGLSREQARESLAFLMRYVGEHFQTEERFMEDLGFPGLAAHRAEHDELTGMTQDLAIRLAGGEPVTMDVTIFISDWLQRHIRESDLKYVAFLHDTHRN